MRKLIASMNMTLDGICDHTVMNADDELHDHYTEALNNAETIIYGRKTYELMESYWPTVVKNPTDNKATNDFAYAIEKIEKIVFSNIWKAANKKLSWNKSRVAGNELTQEVTNLKQQPGGDIYVGSPSLIVACTNRNLIDEYQILVQPAIQGSGMQLFKNIKERTNLEFIRAKTFKAGFIVLYYERHR